MARRATLRASDADRELVADHLRNATAEGRLLAEELEERLGVAFSARTYGELDSLVADLPRPRENRRPGGVLWVRAALALAGLLTVLAAAAVAAFMIAGLLATWVMWAALGWVFFGRLGGGRYGRYGWRVGPARYVRMMQSRPSALRQSRRPADR